MAIIYTYPEKTTPILADLVLITDTESTNPSNQTKTATLTSLKTALDVRSVDATAPLQATLSTGTVTISSRAFGGAAITGYVPSSAAANQNTTFLRADGTWAAPASGGSGTVTQVNPITLGTTGTNLSSTVANSNTTPTITLQVPDASGSARGALTSDDWTAFNNKQAALVSGSNIKTINNASILGSGNLSVTAGAAGSAVGNIQYRDANGSLAANTDFSYFPNTTTLSVKNQIYLVGTNSQPGKIRVQCSNTGQGGNHYVEIQGPDHNNSPSNYSIQLPNKIATQSAYSSGGRILESNANGALQWIATPTSGSGGGISFATNPTPVATAIATYGSATTANTVPEIRATGNGQLTFDTAAGNSGIIYQNNALQVGDIGGDSKSVELHADADAKIIAAPSLTTSTQLTQFNSGLKFTSNGETLQAYEEGNWTPTSANSGNTVSSASGTYVKIGKIVKAEFAFTVAAASGQGGTSIEISGLPFAGVYQSALQGGAIISFVNSDFVQAQIVGGQFSGATTFTFAAYTGAGQNLPTKLKTATATVYQTGTSHSFAGVIIYTSTT